MKTVTLHGAISCKDGEVSSIARIEADGDTREEYATCWIQTDEQVAEGLGNMYCIAEPFERICAKARAAWPGWESRPIEPQQPPETERGEP